MHSLSATFQNILIQVCLHGTIAFIQNTGAISFLPVWKNSSGGNTARLLLHEALSLEEVGTKTYLLLYLFLECAPWPFQILTFLLPFCKSLNGTLCQALWQLPELEIFLFFLSFPFLFKDDF